jgi:hypothetical protein
MSFGAKLGVPLGKAWGKYNQAHKLIVGADKKYSPEAIKINGDKAEKIFAEAAAMLDEAIAEDAPADGTNGTDRLGCLIRRNLKIIKQGDANKLAEDDSCD